LKCQICDGQYEDRLVARAYRRDGKVIVVDDVPVEVCSQCGDVLLKPETVEMIQAALNEAEQAKDFAPVVHLRTQAA
jgi:YgiT-type zinc finger domain-containing protein